MSWEFSASDELKEFASNGTTWYDVVKQAVGVHAAAPRATAEELEGLLADRMSNDVSAPE